MFFLHLFHFTQISDVQFPSCNELRPEVHILFKVHYICRIQFEVSHGLLACNVCYTSNVSDAVCTQVYCLSLHQISPHYNQLLIINRHKTKI
jgi:hypothetical protein